MLALPTLGPNNSRTHACQHTLRRQLVTSRVAGAKACGRALQEHHDSLNPKSRQHQTAAASESITEHLLLHQTPPEIICCCCSVAQHTDALLECLPLGLLGADLLLRSGGGVLLRIVPQGHVHCSRGGGARHGTVASEEGEEGV